MDFEINGVVYTMEQNDSDVFILNEEGKDIGRFENASIEVHSVELIKEFKLANNL